MNFLFLFTLIGNASQRLVEAQPETRAMMNFIQNQRFTLSVALDGGALVATYPYDKPVQTGNTTMTKRDVKIFGNHFNEEV